MSEYDGWHQPIKETSEFVYTEFVYTVVVSADNKEQAEKVMRERLDHGEDYGFPYTLNVISKKLKNPLDNDDK
jgi:hypothetical protein